MTKLVYIFANTIYLSIDYKIEPPLGDSNGARMVTSGVYSIQLNTELPNAISKITNWLLSCN